MKVSKNTKDVWENVWRDPGLVKNDELILEAERASIRWKRIKDQLQKNVGSLQGLTVLEIGSGIGTYSALLAQEGAKATLLDYSPSALSRAKEFFANNKLKAQYIQGDALHLPKELKGKKFDLSISVGLTEHFKDSDRVEIHRQHLNVLKKGGIAVVIVPNAYNAPYRVFKAVSQAIGTWKYGEEYPFTRAELKSIARKVNGEVIAILGDDLYQSLKFLLPANFLRRYFKVGTPRSLSEIREEKGTFLDQYLGYSLVLMMRKI